MERYYYTIEFDTTCQGRYWYFKIDENGQLARTDTPAEAIQFENAEDAEQYMSDHGMQDVHAQRMYTNS